MRLGAKRAGIRPVGPDDETMRSAAGHGRLQDGFGALLSVEGGAGRGGGIVDARTLSLAAAWASDAGPGGGASSGGGSGGGW